jgi:hypothetical protein
MYIFLSHITCGIRSLSVNVSNTNPLMQSTNAAQTRVRVYAHTRTRTWSVHVILLDFFLQAVMNGRDQRARRV